jgi:di/tricarboxylate transporter
VSGEAWVSVVTVLGVIVGMAFSRVPAYLILLAGLMVLMVGGIVEPTDALAGFANPGVITIGVLFVVAAGLGQTGVLAQVVQRFLGRPKSVVGAQARLTVPVAVGSAFMNNTPVVAMLVPVVLDWGKSSRIAASKLLIPLSYAAILGGVCTLIGTSTNLVVNGLLIESGLPALGMFDISLVGVPIAITGIALMLATGRFLLPDRRGSALPLDDPKQYTVEMTVAPTGPLVGRSIEDAGLRHLPGLYLMEIHRAGRVIPVVDPAEKLIASDQLIFVGLVDSVVDLQKTPGLVLATQQLFKLDAPRSERYFAEAVISPRCPIVGKTIREGRFRTRYNAVVIAVARNGERVQARLGDVVLEPGDAVLVEALPSFIEQHRNSNDFYVVYRLDHATPPTPERAPVALAILVAMVFVAATGVLDMLEAGALAAGAMLLTRCCSEETARRAIDWQLLLAIGASFGLGAGLEQTGAASEMATTLLSVAGTNPWLALIVIHGITMLLTSMVTNGAAAVIMFPIAIATASSLEVAPMPFVITLMVAASASFATPISYQTNLMVYGVGGYRFSDFLRMGVPMNIVVWAVSTGLTPIMFPF